MEIILSTVGIIIIIVSLILGIMSRELTVFVAFLFSGILSSLIFFALSILISNQERLLQLLASNQNKKDYITQDQIECKNCGKSYGSDRSSCPYCGQR